jgi:hypothetical protein
MVAKEVSREALTEDLPGFFDGSSCILDGILPQISPKTNVRYQLKLSHPYFGSLP